MTLHDASIRQRQAANPALSTWLSANAGSGKTKVLTDRVARLLLSGTEPQRILCLTYTKAAAAEMQNRLFRRLGEWAMMERSALYDALEALGLDEAPDDETLAQARRLFARAIETPGGLKIQTIHSFCASLLRRFPLEAQVSPGFIEMDDRSGELLRDEIIEDLAERRPDLIGQLANLYTGENFLSVARMAVAHRAHYRTTRREDLPALLDVLPGDSTAGLLHDVFDGSEGQWMGRVAQALSVSGKNDAKAAAKLKLLDLNRPSLRDLKALEGILLTGATAKAPFTAKIGSFPTKAGQDLVRAELPALEALMEAVEAARPRRIALMALQKAEALHDFAAAFLPEYERRKQLRGWLDFDDLIVRARDLLSVSSVAQWVLYRLDGGIDHILVDEAQDTGPDQWRVIELLAQEFTSGIGARDKPRTIFVVGDKKQSIYSFQGADLRKFEEMQRHFSTNLAAMGNQLQELPLQYSFRSSPAVLQAVDATCAPFESLGIVSHIAFNEGLPGRVDLWPLLEPEDEPDQGEWFDPVDLPSPRAPAVVLAETIAKEIRRLIEAGTQLPTRDGTGRAMKAGDVLILVQRRQQLFHELIRACKAEGLPIAGADRLKLGGELAVKDLAALLSFLATQEDDLSLAIALRSPLFGWSEQDLFNLAAGRGDKYLWEVLRHREDHAQTLAVLRDLRDRADYLRPFELIDRMLTRHDGRRRLIARLGSEAEDGIDQFLGQALIYERTEVPSLTGFLTWLTTDDVEIKRQSDAAGDRIRVMTVHGSKGLEAPVVILPDTGDRMYRNHDEAILIEGEVPVWKTPDLESPEAVRAAQADLKARWAEENQRLLYVAMTRAESWLITAAAGKASNETSWHVAIENGLRGLGATAYPTPLGVGLRYALGDWPADLPPESRPAPSDTARTPLPAWTKHHAPPTEPKILPITPSDLGGPKALGGLDGLEEEEAKSRGTALHLLLEQLPDYSPELWEAIAESLPGYAPDLLDEAATVLENPDFAPLFGPESLAEVGVNAQIGERLLVGTIDRLLVGETRVLIVDYKTNATVPDSPAAVPEGILRQMGAYRAAIAEIYPNRQIDAAILWTRRAELMALPNDIIDAAFARAKSDKPPRMA